MGFFDNLLHAGETAASDVGGFFGGLARGVANAPVPGTGVNVGQVAQQIPSAVGQVGNAINQLPSNNPVGRAVFGQTSQEREMAGGNTLTELASNIPGPEAGVNDIGRVPTAAEDAVSNVGKAGGFFDNLVQSGIKQITGNSKQDSPLVQSFTDGQKIQGEESAISNFAKSVADTHNAPATATFNENPQGKDTQYIFQGLTNPWGLLKNLSDQGVAASFDNAGNVVAHDTEGLAKPVINQVVKDSNIQPPTTIKGDVNIQEGSNYAADQTAVQPAAKGASSAVSDQAAKDSGGVQNPVLSEKPVNATGQGEGKVLSPITGEEMGGEPPSRTPQARAGAGLPEPKGETTGDIPDQVDPLKYQVSGKRALFENVGKGETDVLKAGDRSPEAQTFGARAEDAIENASSIKSPALTSLEETRKSIPKGEQQAVVDALEGKDVKISTQAQAWVDQARKTLADMAQKAKAVGLRVYDPTSNSFHDFEDVKNFFPHYATADVKAALQGKNNEVIQNLIKEKLATNPETARAYLNSILNSPEARRYGHLEIGRVDSNLPYVKDPKAVEQYIKDASDRIAWANQFGRDNEEAQKLIAGMKARGDDYGAQQATKFLQKYGNLRESDMVREGANKLVSGVRTAETTSKLEFVALKHLSQIPRAMAQNGIFRSLAQSPEALAAFFRGEASPAVRQLSEVFHEDITGEDFMRTDSNKIGNAFMKAVGFKNTITAVREFAARGASAQLDSFVAKQSATADRMLAKAGLDAEKIRSAGGPTLAERQQYVNKALQNTSLYFKKGSMPAGWDTGVGKLVTMFKRFGYNDAVRGWASWVDEAKHGNVTPLMTALAGTTAVGFGYIHATAAIRGKSVKGGFFSQLGQSAQAGGVGGLPGEQVLQAALNPQYLNSQLTSLAGGPVASDVGQQVTDIGNLVKGTAAQQKSAVSNELGNIPLVGPLIQNRASDSVTQALQAMGLTPQQSPTQKAIAALTGGSNPLGGGGSSNPLASTSSSSASSRMAAQRRAQNAQNARARRSASFQRSAGARRARAASSKLLRSRGSRIKTAKVKKVR